MVLTVTRRVSNNKENATLKVPSKSKSGTRPHRKRSGTSSRKGCSAPSGEHRHPAATAGTSAAAVATPAAAGTSALTCSNEDGGHASLASGDAAATSTTLSSSSPLLSASKGHYDLPRRLFRPAYRAVPSAGVSAIEPSLAKVPIEYIQQKLKDVGERMYAMNSQIKARCPKGVLPRKLEVVVMEPLLPDVPTHIFAICSSVASQKRRAVLYPVHGLVVAAHCANLPVLPQSQPQSGATNVSLPVVPLALPSPPMFPLLLAYLYKGRVQEVLSALFPFGVADAAPRDHLKRTIEACSVSGLLSLAMKTHGLWSIVATLGIFDQPLWRTIEYAWATLLDAIAAKTGSTWHTR